MAHRWRRSRLVVVVTGIDSGKMLERWQFNVCVEDGSNGVEVSMMAGNDGKVIVQCNEK